MYGWMDGWKNQQARISVLLGSGSVQTFIMAEMGKERERENCLESICIGSLNSPKRRLQHLEESSRLWERESLSSLFYQRCMLSKQAVRLVKKRLNWTITIKKKENHPQTPPPPNKERVVVPRSVPTATTHGLKHPQASYPVPPPSKNIVETMAGQRRQHVIRRLSRYRTYLPT